MIESGGAPAVSVVLPFRDAAATLGDALESLRSQSLENFECILVDHRSQDGSAQIAAQCSEVDHRFKLTRTEGTFVQALNHGVAESRAALVARMDADDLCHPTRLEKQVAALRDDPQLQLVSCLVDCFPHASVGGGMKRYQDWINGIVSDQQIREALFVESPIPHPSATFRRDLFVSLGGYLETDGPEDYDLWLRMLLSGATARKIPEMLVRWRDSPQRMSRCDERYSKAQFLETKLRHFPSAVPRSKPLQIWGTGPTARRWSRRLREDGYRIERFVDAIESRVGRIVHGHVIEDVSCLERGDSLTLAAVGILGARAEIDEILRARGFEPLRDYLAVA